MDNMMEITLAVSSMKGQIPKERPLKERLAFAMNYVVKNERDLFWMSYKVDDDLLLKTALAAVMTEATESEKDIIARSLAPLKAFSAAITGVQVDFSALALTDDLLPLLGMFKDAKDKPADPPNK